MYGCSICSTLGALALFTILAVEYFMNMWSMRAARITEWM